MAMRYLLVDATARQALVDAVVTVILAITGEWQVEDDDEGVD